MTLCACGCGKETKLHRGRPNRYLLGHSRIGKEPSNKGGHISEEQKERLRFVNLGKKRPESDKIKISQTMKARKINIGDKNPSKRPEVKEKISIGIQKYQREHPKEVEEANKKAGKSRERLWRTNAEYRAKMLAVKNSEKVREKVSQSISKYFREHPEETRQRNRKAGETRKLLWKNPKFAEKMAKAMFRRPNKDELRIDSILQLNFPNEWAYVGDGKLWIEGKNPDFINRNGKKAIIEYNGISYRTKDGLIVGHTAEKDAAKTQVYAGYGYKTLNLYKKDLRDEKSLIEKIRTFLS